MYHFKTQFNQFESDKPKMSGRRLLEIMGLNPAEEYELFIKVDKREFEPVQPDEIIDLTQPGIEIFRVRRRFEVSYEFDDEVVASYECFVTPSQLLKKNGYNPQKFYLKKIEGNREINYKNDPEHHISLRNGDKFISFKKSATPVA